MLVNKIGHGVSIMRMHSDSALCLIRYHNRKRSIVNRNDNRLSIIQTSHGVYLLLDSINSADYPNR